MAAEAQGIASPAEKKAPRPPKEAWESTNTVFTNDKAGMLGYDKDRVKKIIYEMSKNSPHFRNEQRKQQQSEARIQRMLEQAKKLSAQELAGFTKNADAKITALLASRDLSRTWIHVDLDAFYASVEELDNPSLKTKPMGVGGLGMLATANYVARRYGVRSAMPGFIARRLCPELVFVKPDFRKYSKAGQAVRAIFREFDADMESGSLDEAYLDITDYCQQHGMTGSEVAAEMRARVLAQTGLTCSCGIAPNRMLAKVCSDMNKPNGQFELPADPADITRFTDTLPIRKIPGIGKVAEQELRSLGVMHCSDLIMQRGLLTALHSEIAIDSFLEAGLGLGRTRHPEALKEGQVGRKGISVERTFSPISHQQDLEAKCCELAEKLAEDMEIEDLRGKTLTLKLKPPNFELKTRAVTLPHHICAKEEIEAIALRLLRAELPIQVRLMGLRMSSFLEVNLPLGQQSLASFFKPKDAGQSSAAIDQAHADEGKGNETAAVGVLEEMVVDGETDVPTSPPSQERSLQAPKDHHSGKGGQRKAWSCQLCTFADNPWHFLRCMICDERRGTTSRDFAHEEEGPAKNSSRQDSTREQDGCQGTRSSLLDHDRKRKADHVPEEPAASRDGHVCSICGELVAGKEQEHADYHLALELESGFGSGSSKGKASAGVKQKGTGQSDCNKRKHGRNMPTITSFFRPSGH